MKARFYQALMSEMSGSPLPFRSEETTVQLQSPYAAAMAYSCRMAKNYSKGRETLACDGSLSTKRRLGEEKILELEI
ncbi:MAG: GDP-mannose 4,6-dehydratase [Planctomycetota bacterium]